MIRITTVLATLVYLCAVPALAGGNDWIRQTVYGMDCAPCAYGVERSLGHLEGVASVTVSLERGEIEIEFVDGAEPDLARIRELVRRGGFTPRAAEVCLTGMIEAPDAFTTGVHRYRIVAVASNLAENAARRVALHGRVDEDATGRITVTRIAKSCG